MAKITEQLDGEYVVTWEDNTGNHLVTINHAADAIKFVGLLETMRETEQFVEDCK